MKFLKNALYAVMVSSILSVFAFSACACAPGTVEEPQTVTVTADQWNDYLVTPQAEKYYKITDEIATEQEDARFSSVSFSVEAGERYLVSFGIGVSGVYGILFTDENYEVREKLFASKNTHSEFNNVQLTVPDGVEYIVVNSHTPKEIEVKKYFSVTKNVEKKDLLPSELTLACVNCGQFDYGDGTTSSTAYKAEWESLVNETNADLFMFEDSLDTYSTGVKTDELFTRETQGMYGAGGVSAYLRCASSYAPRTVAIVPVEYCIEGSTKTTARFYALRFTFLVGEKQVAVYGLHLVAESHISDVQQADGSSLSQKLRRLQFASLIRDGKNYDECIFMGDFNAQRADEYEIFRAAGFTLTNCSETYGTNATLRDIPADNIIVSGGIEVKNFSVKSKDDYNLNTDHCPLVAEISFS